MWQGMTQLQRLRPSRLRLRQPSLRTLTSLERQQDALHIPAAGLVPVRQKQPLARVLVKNFQRGLGGPVLPVCAPGKLLTR